MLLPPLAATSLDFPFPVSQPAPGNEPTASLRPPHRPSPCYGSYILLTSPVILWTYAAYIWSITPGNCVLFDTADINCKPKSAPPHVKPRAIARSNEWICLWIGEEWYCGLIHLCWSTVGLTQPPLWYTCLLTNESYLGTEENYERTTLLTL